MTPEAREELPQRYPFVSVVGTVGSGKSSFTEPFVEETGATLFQEPFQENPYLGDFYTKSHKDFSFPSQMFFLATNGLQAMKLRGLTAGNLVVQDAGRDIDLMIATVHWKMGWMTDEQHQTYLSSFKSVYKDLLNPDVYIALKASEETVIKRIKKRGREMELKMIDDCPQYFPTLVKEFNGWLKNRIKENNIWVVVVDSEKFNFTSGPDQKYVLTDIKNWLSYFISNPIQRNEVGSDGSRLIVPDSFKTMPRIVDTVPGFRMTH
jgi:deoxyadenosine/deoxycytidine kinase